MGQRFVIHAITVGPLSLPVGPLLLAAAFFASAFVARRAGRGAGADAETHLYIVFLMALLAARSAFVVQFFDAYVQAPLSIVDIRDGGWTPAAGLLAGGLYAAGVAWRRAPLRRPVLAAAVMAGVLWTVGAMVPHLLRDDGPALPAITLSDLSGQQVPLGRFAGRPTVVNLWATWCPPCRREMPVLQQGQAEHRDIQFVFLNQGESADKVRAFLTAQRLPLHNVLLDTQGQASAQLGHRSLPTTLFYDTHGRLVDTRVGELSSATLAQRLRYLQPGAAPR